MSSGRQSLLNMSATVRTLLRCIGRVNRNSYPAKLNPKILQPLSELIPTSIINRFGETVIFNQVLNPQVCALTRPASLT